MQYVINHSKLREIDQHLNLSNYDEIDKEIDKLIFNLWNNTGKYESLMKPFFTCSLQYNYLRPLYIYYFSLKNLKEKNKKISIESSTSIIDIIAKELDIFLKPDRSFYDDELSQNRWYEFVASSKKRKILKFIYFNIRNLFTKNNYETIYLNAGKLDSDFKEIPNSISGFDIPISIPKLFNLDIRSIRNQMIENINTSKTSIPKQLILNLIQTKFFTILPNIINKINIYINFIKKYNVKLVIITAPTHEDHLCLVAAAKFCECKSLTMGHGIILINNKLLDYVDYQAKINDFDPQYKVSKQFKVNQNWFDKKLKL